MAKIAVKSTDGSVQITDTLTGVVRTIPKGDKWHITQSTNYSTLYWYDDAEVVIYQDRSEPGNSIFGALTPATLSDAIISGSIESSSSGGGGGAVSGRPIDVSQGLDASVDLEDIKTNVAASLVTLNQIHSELVNSKSIADLLIEDAAGNYYVRQESVDQTTGIISVTLLNLDGSAASPLPILPLSPVKTKESSVVVEEDYVSLTAGTGRSIGDEISIVKILSPTTGNILNTLYFNVTTNTTLAAITPVTTELKSLDDSDNEILDGLWNARNRYSVNYYRAITDDLVNNYWVKGDIIQLAFTEQKGVGVSNLSNLTSFAMPNLAIGAVGAPTPGTSFKHVEEILTETSDRIRMTSTSGAFGINNVYTRVRYTTVKGVLRYESFFLEATGVFVVGVPVPGSFIIEGNSSVLGNLTPNNLATKASTVAGIFNTVPPVLTTGQMVPLQLNNSGSLKVVNIAPGVTVTGSINPSADTALTAGKRLFRILVNNTSAGSVFLQFHNSVAPIVLGAVPLAGYIFRIPSNQTVIIDETTFSQSGELISANLRVGISSTFGTYTPEIAGTLSQLSTQYKLEV